MGVRGEPGGRREVSRPQSQNPRHFYGTSIPKHSPRPSLTASTSSSSVGGSAGVTAGMGAGMGAGAVEEGKVLSYGVRLGGGMLGIESGARGIGHEKESQGTSQALFANGGSVADGASNGATGGNRAVVDGAKYVEDDGQDSKQIFGPSESVAWLHLEAAIRYFSSAAIHAVSSGETSHKENQRSDITKLGTSTKAVGGKFTASGRMWLPNPAAFQTFLSSHW